MHPINSAEDPRVLEARALQREYEKGLESDQYGTALSLLRAMDGIYQNTAGYEHSFERGVVWNNMASVYLVQLETAILGEGDIDRTWMVATLDTAELYLRKAITVYNDWVATMGTLSKAELERIIRPTFDLDDPKLTGKNVETLIKKRVDDLLLAQIENKRRLSVTYANLGMVERYQGNLEEAKGSYEKAIALWDRNYTAKNNLNILLNRPVEKRSMVDRLFPPERAAELKK
ncbi:MAG: hypothetical protein CSB34_02895 [Desulfobulbus propionicus]|nr:MAG: hypothetical protein CSB34_02895 [Desulfobulbus propionicus]